MLKLGGWPRLTWGRGARRLARPGGGARAPCGVPKGPVPLGPGATASGSRARSPRFRPPLAVPVPAGGPRLGPPRSRAGGQSPRPAPVGARSDAMRDAQAGVPSAGWPRAQLAFKDSMVRGILQFTPSIAFRYVLHRCESRDIRCRESYVLECRARRRPAARAGAGPVPTVVPWRAPRRGVSSARRAASARGGRVPRGGGPEGRACPPAPAASVPSSRVFRSFRVSTMILPQVHLRKPCYDFSFL